MSVSQKVESRISTELKRYRQILESAKQRDVSESDTVIIVADMLSDLFGYDKHQHITTEFAIRSTYVDLAVIVEKDIRFLVEVKAIGAALKDTHVKQAIDYGANKGVEWVILTNGITWRVYKIYFSQPIEKSLVFEIDVLAGNPKSPELIECFGNLSKEGFSKGSMAEFLQQKQVTSRYAIAAALLSDSILDELRRELRRISPGLRVDASYLRAVLEGEVIKRELVDSEEATAATALIKKLQRSQAREKRKSAESATSNEDAQVTIEEGT